MELRGAANRRERRCAETKVELGRTHVQLLQVLVARAVRADAARSVLKNLCVAARRRGVRAEPLDALLAGRRDDALELLLRAVERGATDGVGEKALDCGGTL
jgi:hypothetical protein